MARLMDIPEETEHPGREKASTNVDSSTVHGALLSLICFLLSFRLLSGVFLGTVFVVASS